MCKLYVINNISSKEAEKDNEKDVENKTWENKKFTKDMFRLLNISRE